MLFHLHAHYIHSPGNLHIIILTDSAIQSSQCDIADQELVNNSFGERLCPHGGPIIALVRGLMAKRLQGFLCCKAKGQKFPLEHLMRGF